MVASLGPLVSDGGRKVGDKLLHDHESGCAEMKAEQRRQGSLEVQDRHQTAQ